MKKKLRYLGNEAFFQSREQDLLRNTSVERATYTLISSSIADLNKFCLSGSNLLGSKCRDLIFFKIVNFSWLSMNMDGDAQWKLYQAAPY